MAAVSYPLRIPEEILALAKLRSKEEYVDQSTAIRQLLHLGAEEYVLGLVESGRISIGRASELLKTSVQDVHRLAEKHGVRLGATVEQQRKSTETMRRLK
ncbi:hypothetical protein HYY74_03825 [Candidatus Woesearchaeota archaeon]|nr:hypothetical protein [Candidatus Woesearchaeota archaeon]